MVQVNYFGRGSPYAACRRRREDGQTPAMELSWKTSERSALFRRRNLHFSSTVATKFNRAVRFGVGFTDLLNIYGLGVSEQTKYIEIYKWAVARGTRLPNCLRKPTASDLRASNEFADIHSCMLKFQKKKNRQSEYNDQRKGSYTFHSCTKSYFRKVWDFNMHECINGVNCLKTAKKHISPHYQGLRVILHAWARNTTRLKVRGHVGVWTLKASWIWFARIFTNWRQHRKRI
jgi:hypothetical protein